MRAHNPDNHILYSLASATLKKCPDHPEIKRRGAQIQITTDTVDFKLSPLRHHQISLNVRMAPAYVFSSNATLAHLLLTTVIALAKKHEITIQDLNFSKRSKLKSSNTQQKKDQKKT